MAFTITSGTPFIRSDHSTNFLGTGAAPAQNEWRGGDKTKKIETYNYNFRSL